MSNAILDCTKNFKLYKNLGSFSSWNHCFECKFEVQVLLFDMIPAWVMHKKVNIF